MKSPRILACLPVSLHPRTHFAGWIAVPLLACASPSSLHADDKFWSSFFDAAFNDASKWTGGVPGMDDVAHFGRTTNPLLQQASYAVDFDVSPINQRFLIEDDFVTFDLNGRTYTTTLVAGSEVGNVAGRTGRLTVMEGTLALGTNSLFEVGAAANASGFFTVTTGAIVNGTPFLAIGESGSGTLTVLNGGRVNAGLLMLGSSGTATGTASITGANTIFDIASGGTTSIGAASGTTDMLTVQSGGTFSSGTGAIAIGATGTVAILGGTFNAAGDMTVNGLVIRDSGGAFNLATGRTLTVQNGGGVSITGTFIQPNSATITITGIDSMFSVTSILEMEGDSSITNVLAGGSLSSGTAPIFLGQASAPTVNVDGSGSTFSGGNLFLGVTGGTLTFTNGSGGTFGTISVADSTFQGSSGVLSIQSGATVSGAGLSIATTAVSHTGIVTVTGSDSALTLTGASTMNLGAGAASTGRLEVQNGGTFTSGTGAITVGKTGTVAITGGTFNANGDMTVNGLLTRDSTGVFDLAEGKTLTIQNGGDVMITSALFHDTASTITITGVGSTLTATAALFFNGGSTTNVLAGGRLSAGAGAPLALIASFGPGNTTVLVDGSGSTFTGSNGTLGLGEVATGTLTFSNGSSGSFGPINVAGLTNSSFGNGTLNIQSGATLSGSNLNVALGQSMTTGTITITGAGSALTLSNTAMIGAASMSTATLNVQSGGTFAAGAGLTQVNATGTVAIMGGILNASGNVTLNGGKLTRDAAGTFNLAAGKTLTVQSGGDAMFTGSYTAPSSMTLNVSGTGSTFSTTSAFMFGNGSVANVSSGGALEVGTTASIGSSGGSGVLFVDGSDSSFDAGTLTIGHDGLGNVFFSTGSTGNFGAINVNSAGTAATAGLLQIMSGAKVSATSLDVDIIAVMPAGGVAITGAGSELTLSGTATIGGTGASTGTLNVADGGTFTTGTGLTTVNATGDLNVLSGGTMIVRGDMIVHSSLDIEGTVILDATAPTAPGEFVSMPERDLGFNESDHSAAADIASVPEPGIGALLASTLALWGSRRRGKRSGECNDGAAATARLRNNSARPILESK